MVYYDGSYNLTFFKKSYQTQTIQSAISSTDKKYIKNTWKDWGLIPSSGLNISIKKSVIDIPSGNGSIDLSRSITGYSLYSNRTGTFEFLALNKNLDERGYSSSSDLVNEIMNFFTQDEVFLWPSNDKFFFYEGLFWLENFNIDKNISKISIGYDVFPYKKAIQSTTEGLNWLWDPFDFNNGFIQDYFYLTATTLHNGDKIKIICGNEPKIIKLHFSFAQNFENYETLSVKCNNENTVYSFASNPYSFSGGDLLLNNVLANVNVEKELTFSMPDLASVRLDIDYRGGYL